MSDELFYTSVPRGLRPGASGFCTVAATATLGPAWIARLESISGYKPRYPAGDPRADDNPIAYAHVRLSVAGQARSVLTRAASAGADHTGRGNVFVHHVLPTDGERGPAGPAWVMRQPGVMEATWTAGEPRTLARGRAVPTARPAAAPATAWQREAGDAAWAAALAGPAVDDPAAIVYVVYAPGTDVLALFDEAIRLLPEPQRWLVTFNTYLTEPPAAGTTCAWRGVMSGTPAVALARGTVIDLTSIYPSEVPRGPLAEAARTGDLRRPIRPTPDIGSETLDAGATSPQPNGTGPVPLDVRAARSAIDPSRVVVRSTGMPSNVRLPPDVGKPSKVPLALGISAAAIAVVAAVVGAILLNRHSAGADAGASTTATRSVSPPPLAHAISEGSAAPAVTSGASASNQQAPPKDDRENRGTALRTAEAERTRVARAANDVVGLLGSIAAAARTEAMERARATSIPKEVSSPKRDATSKVVAGLPTESETVAHASWLPQALERTSDLPAKKIVDARIGAYELDLGTTSQITFASARELSIVDAANRPEGWKVDLSKPPSTRLTFRLVGSGTSPGGPGVNELAAFSRIEFEIAPEGNRLRCTFSQQFERIANEVLQGAREQASNSTNARLAAIDQQKLSDEDRQRQKRLVSVEADRQLNLLLDGLRSRILTRRSEYLSLLNNMSLNLADPEAPGAVRVVKLKHGR